MKKRKIIAGICVLISIIIICVATTIAKYLLHKGEQSKITSQNFYFSSNFLKSDEVPTYEIHGNTVTFEVRNFIDRIRYNATGIDIFYTVSADVGSLKKAGEAENYAGEQLTLTGGAENSESITLTYEFADGEKQKEVTVTATSTGVYAKTLKAKFILLNTDGLAYEIKDKADRDYAELYIYMGKTEQDVTLKWDKAHLVIDETNDYVFGKVQNQVSPEKSYVEINNIAADTTVKIVFFKNVITENYTCSKTPSDGTITIS